MDLHARFQSSVIHSLKEIGADSGILTCARNAYCRESHRVRSSQSIEMLQKNAQSLYTNLYSDWVDVMNNHFGKGLMTGMNMAGPCSATIPAKFCNEYIHGFVIGYCYQLEQKTGERCVAALEAGRLTRRYNLDREIMTEFFVEFRTDKFLQYFNIGYSGGLN